LKEWALVIEEAKASRFLFDSFEHDAWYFAAKQRLSHLVYSSSCVRLPVKQR